MMHLSFGTQCNEANGGQGGPNERYGAPKRLLNQGGVWVSWRDEQRSMSLSAGYVTQSDLREGRVAGGEGGRMT